MSNDIVTRLRKYHDDEYLSYRHVLEAADEIERLQNLLRTFDTHFVCEECDKACATYLQGCENPLHALHTAAWELF